MPRLSTRSIFLSFLFLLFSLTCVFAAEEITITTYYPSPYGSYNQLQTRTLGVGDNNGNNVLDSGDVPDPAGNPGDVWIKGKVGIGTTNPEAALDMGSGGIRLGGVIKTNWPGQRFWSTGVLVTDWPDWCPNNTWTLVPGLSLTINLSEPKNVQVTGVVTSTNGIVYNLKVDNLVLPGLFIQDSGSITMVKIFSLSAGNHTVSVVWKGGLEGSPTGCYHHGYEWGTSRYLDIVEF